MSYQHRNVGALFKNAAAILPQTVADDASAQSSVYQRNDPRLELSAKLIGMADDSGGTATFTLEHSDASDGTFETVSGSTVEVADDSGEVDIDMSGLKAYVRINVDVVDDDGTDGADVAATLVVGGASELPDVA